MSDPPGFPWLYPYQEEEAPDDSVVLRPVVPVSLIADAASPPVAALVDSGSEHVLAAAWLAEVIGIDLDVSTWSLELGIGGHTVDTRFADVELRLHRPGDRDDEYVEWHAEVGFVSQWRPTWPVLLGQSGFFDQFTVTMSRHAQSLAIDGWEHFDSRFDQ